MSDFMNLVAGQWKAFTAAVTGGAASAGQLLKLDGNGLISPTVLPAGVGDDLVTAQASEALTAGAIVNVYTNAGALAVRNADAATANSGKKASGFVLNNVASNATATIYSHGLNTGLTGLTPGADYYLGAAGAVTSAPPSASGTTCQYLGTATSATALDVQPGVPVAIQ